MNAQPNQMMARTWRTMWSLLGLVLVANIIWCLVRPLLPILILGGLVLAGISAWRQRRWQ